jgi:hypothetical protein
MFTGVFNGTPTEVVTSPWPLTVSSGNILTGPTYDSNTGDIFVGASNGTLYKVVASSGAITSVAVGIGSGSYGGIVDAPIVDPSTGYVFAAAGELASTYGCTNSGGGVVQENEAFTSTVHECLGEGDVDNIHTGTFDNLYFTSVSTGHMYWVGGDGSSTLPALWYLGFLSSGVVTSATEATGGILASTANDASPLTETYNTYSSTDWLFGSMPGESCGGATSGGCIMSFNITSGAPTIFPWRPSAAYAASTELVDTNGNLQECTSSIGGCNGTNTTGTTVPTWNTTTGDVTTDGTAASASQYGVFSGTVTVSGSAKIGFGTNTLTISPTTPVVTFSAHGTSTDTITIDGVVFTAGTTSNSCSSSTAGTYEYGTSADNSASNLATAISSYPCQTTHSIPFTATSSGAAVTITFKATSGTVSTNDPSATWAWGATTGATSITTGNVCSSSTTAYFTVSATASDEATYLADAINACTSSSIGVTATANSPSSGDTTVTAYASGIWGNSVTLSETLTNFAWNGGATALSGGTGLNWTNEGAGNGQASAVQATGTSGIVIDNVNNPSWAASTAYALGALIVDSNGNVEECTTAGTSKSGTHPTWNTTVGDTTTDGTVTWTNEGSNPTANLYLGTLGGAKDAVKYTQAGLD